MLVISVGVIGDEKSPPVTFDEIVRRIQIIEVAGSLAQVAAAVETSRTETL